LLGRLAYEVAFNIIPEAAIKDNWWLSSSLRDHGHHKRMVILWHKVKNEIKIENVERKYYSRTCKAKY